jgi:hypothetical protein
LLFFPLRRLKMREGWAVEAAQLLSPRPEARIPLSGDLARPVRQHEASREVLREVSIVE